VIRPSQTGGRRVPRGSLRQTESLTFVQRSRERRARRVPAPFADADLELAETLDSLDGAANYCQWIYDLVRPHLGPDVLEIGAGHGTFTVKLAADSAVRHVMASDLSERCVHVLRERFAGFANVEVRHADLGALKGAGLFDAAILINVLEHIEDDRAALDQLHHLLRDRSGRLVLWVPALRYLYSDCDRRFGHYRRYHASGLRALLEAASFDIVEMRYVNPIGAIMWFVFARLLGLTPTKTGSVQFYDRYVVPIVRPLERRARPPLGQSILAVAVPRPTRGSSGSA
jgi:2-polyprenyl-3-methyl-5-hydroxy-6-metoxy-1,4-benzoquinol methylase